MCLLFLNDQRRDFVTMVEEVTERVENLGLSQSKCFGDVRNWFAAQMKRGNVANGHPQTVNYWLAATQAFEPDNMRMVSLRRDGHEQASVDRGMFQFPV
jgi:hypothetical protein